MEQIVVKRPKSPISEKYRSIRTNLLYANVDRKLKTVIISSPTESEGKTTTSSNLALSLAEMGLSVLLIDCDLRKPRVHQVYDVNPRCGLVNVLMGEVLFEKAVQSSGFSGLSIMTAGALPSNPTELLASKAMGVLLKTAGEQFDYILIDSPPVLPVTDTVMLSTMTDGVLLVCAAEQCQINHAKRAKESIEMVGGKILGAVLNKMPTRQLKFYKTYYAANALDGVGVSD